MNFFIFSIITILSLCKLNLVSGSCLYGTTLMPRPKEGAIASLPNFDYNNVRGPTMWHSLQVNDSDCALGSSQSPINIDDTILATTGIGQVQSNIPQQTVIFENLGTNVEVFLNGTSTFQGQTWNLMQFHYHTPSEHRINGEYFPMEVHMVHEAANNTSQILVVGMLFQLSSTPDFTTAFSTVLNSVSKIPNAGDNLNLTQDDLNLTSISAAVGNTSFHKYNGSLTTPPCSQNVTFLVSETQLSMSVDTYNAMKKVVKFNARYTQNQLGQSNLLELAKSVNLTGEIPLPTIDPPTDGSSSGAGGGGGGTSNSTSTESINAARDVIPPTRAAVVAAKLTEMDL